MSVSCCAKYSNPQKILLHFTKVYDIASNTNNNAMTTSAYFVNNNLIHEQSNVIALPSTSLNVHASKVKTSVFVLLATAIVRVYNEDGKSVLCRALLDYGSQNNFIIEDVSQALK